MTTNTIQWIEATQFVADAESILIVAHVFPDGDAIGALLGLTTGLRERGKRVDAVVDGGVPGIFGFIPGVETVLKTLGSDDWDLMISVDASDEKRSGEAGIYGRKHCKTVINLDHHPTNTLFGDILLVVPEAVSATEIIYDWLINHMAHPLSYEVAVPLLVGLVTDTLGFRTSNVTTRTLAIAQDLMKSGASLTEITARTLDSNSYHVVRLWKEVLPSVEMDGPVIVASVTRNNLEKAGLSDLTDGGLVGFLAKVDEAMIAVVFKETANGKIELSFRSKPGFDVAGVAFDLNGGGHKQASGATIDGPLEAAKARVMPMLHRATREGALAIL